MNDTNEVSEADAFLESIKPVAKDLKQSLANDQANVASGGPIFAAKFSEEENEIVFSWSDPDFYDSFLLVLKAVLGRVLVSDPEFTLESFAKVVELAYLASEEA